MRINRRMFLTRVFFFVAIFSVAAFLFCLNRYVFSRSVKAETLPSYYDLRDVNGKNYVTPLKNQGDRGICWAFATIASFESSLMKQGLASTSDPQIFSEYQLDFALSSDGMRDFRLDQGFFWPSSNGYEAARSRFLTYGGHQAFWFLSEGYAPVRTADFGEENYNSIPIEPAGVFSKDKMEYYVSSYDVLVGDDAETKIETIKRHLMEYGAVYVGTIAPGLSQVIVQTNKSQDGHAMTVIGWDDGYEYVQNGEVKYGAWILKNSWGEDMSYPYLSYSSTEFATFYGAENIKQKDWDENYTDLDKISEKAEYAFYGDVSSYEVYFAKTDVSESIRELNFRNGNPNGGSYDVYISRTGGENDFEFVKTAVESLPGSISVDSIDELVNSDHFAVRIVGRDGALISSKPNVNVFTTKNNQAVGLMANLVVASDVYSYSKTVEINLYTNGVNSDGISIEFYQGNEMVDILKEVSKVKIGDNIYYKFGLNNQSCTISCLSEQQYTVKVFYDNQIIASDEMFVNMLDPVSDIGDGTMENPFIITEPDQLVKIGTNRAYLAEDVFYKLGRNIDFSDYLEDHSFRSIGSVLADAGEDSGFYGTLDGNGYEISNIHASGDGNGMALFYSIDGKVANLVLRNVDFSDQSKVAALALYAYHAEIDGVYILDSTLSTGGSSSGRASSFFDVTNYGVYSRLYSSARIIAHNSMACAFSCRVAGGGSWDKMDDFVFTGDLDGDKMYLLGDLVDLEGKNLAFELDNTKNGYLIRGDYSYGGGISGVFVYLRSGQKLSDVATMYENLKGISNFYATDGMDFIDGSVYHSGMDITMDTYRGLSFDEIDNCKTERGCWNYKNNYPRLNTVNYEYVAEDGIGVSSKYNIDRDDHTISGVKIYKDANEITKRQLVDSFEYFDGEIYESDGVTLAMDDESRIKTNMLIKNGDGVYTISVVGDLNGDGRVNPSDVIILRRYIAGGYGIELNEAQKLAADVNQDGTVGVSDVIQLRRGIAGGYGNDYMIYDMEGN